jgi:hypothetical protein
MVLPLLLNFGRNFMFTDIDEKSRKKLLIIIGIVAIVVVAVAVFLIVANSSKKDPNAIEVVALNQGIKATATAVTNAGKMAMIELTLDDKECEDRVTYDTELSFDSMPSVSSIYAEQVDYDAYTNSAKYRIYVEASDTFDGDSIPLNITGVKYDGTSIGEVKLDIELNEVISQIVGDEEATPNQAPTEVLTPGVILEISKTKFAWLSAVGINNGYLAVQFAQPMSGSREMDANSIMPYLIDPDGNKIYQNGPETMTFLMDKDMAQVSDVEEASYDFKEVYFDLGTENFEGYSLCFSGTVWNIISDQWELEVPLDGQKCDTVTAIGEISAGEESLGNGTLEISEFGMTLTGACEDDDVYMAPLSESVYLETSSGNILLNGLNGSRTGEEYNLIWYSSEDINLKTVKAVHIGDNVIKVK